MFPEAVEGCGIQDQGRLRGEAAGKTCRCIEESAALVGAMVRAATLRPLVPSIECNGCEPQVCDWTNLGDSSEFKKRRTDND